MAAIDFIYRSTKSNKAGQDLQFWRHAMRTAKGASTVDFPKTAEIDAGISARVILTTEPENIKAILTGQFSDYGKGEPFHRDWKEFLGDSIFVTDGEMWSRSRHLIRPMFVRERIVDTEIFEKHVQHLMPLLEGQESPVPARGVDVGPLFFRYTLDAATDYLLGQGTDSLQNPKTTFAEAFRYVQSRQAEMFRLGYVSPSKLANPVQGTNIRKQSIQCDPISQGVPSQPQTDGRFHPTIHPACLVPVTIGAGPETLQTRDIPGSPRPFHKGPAGVTGPTRGHPARWPRHHRYYAIFLRLRTIAKSTCCRQTP